ncbi:hypothetical protein F5X68DRAFT_236292 [Plectosphaerella plurivora]|uniref:Uncharacterized protein n=1 Tax=Plectosphaerella plurivora TaxID=936078 RepID=A0A9P9A654_9PEZI|nr:hypothetical protein F5X68DRAFT_236292 [Plectosphaerella plurivora]
MCRLIVRRFECWETSPGLRAGSPAGHEKKYLARCANPNFTTCIKPTALPCLQECAPPDLSVCRRAAAPYFTAFRDELTLSSYGQANPDLRDAEVLTRYMPFDDTPHSHIMDHLQKLDGLAAQAPINLGGEEPWIAQYLAARNLDQDDDSHFVQAENSYRQQDFASLAENQTWSMLRDDMHPRECMGSIFSNPVRLHTLLRQAAEEGETLISSDLARTSAAALAIDRELTEAEFIAIRRSGVEEPGRGTRCFICGCEMTHGPGQPPSSSHPDGDSRAHRAVYLHCEHVVARNCWEVFGPWPQPVEVSPFWDLV